MGITVIVGLTLESKQIYYQVGGHPLPFLRLWMYGGDILQFQSEFPFAVHFSPLSPILDRMSGSGERSEETGGLYNVTGTIREDIPAGYYKFFVALFDEGRVLTDDPDLIVDPQRPRRP